MNQAYKLKRNIMKRIVCSLIATACLSASATALSASCESAGYNSSNYPKGNEYPLRGASTTYSHDADWNYRDKVATFFTSSGLSGEDEYNYQDFKWRAKKSFKFTSRGPHWVAVIDPVISAIHCNNVFVQEKPKVSNPKLNVIPSSQSAYVSLNYEVDSYSKAARENKDVKITFYWERNGITNTAGTLLYSSLSGGAARYIQIPTVAGTYNISASVYDGKYTTTLFLGSHVEDGSDHGTIPPCPTCDIP